MRGEEGAVHCGGKKKEEKEKEERKRGGEREKKREKGKKDRKKEVEGRICETTKTEESGCKRQGVGKEKTRGRIRVCPSVCLLGFGPDWATLSRLETFYFAKINLAK